MDLNQPSLEKQLKESVTHHSVIGSIHPTINSEGPGIQMEGDQGNPDVMPDWLAQLVARGNNNP